MALERLGSYINLVSGPFHPFGGAVDIVVVQQQDGTFKSSPWYVRFGKFQGVLKSREKIVNISVNGEEAGFHMYLDHKGEAFFLRDAGSVGEEESSGVDFAMSPVSSGDEKEDRMEKHKISQLNQDQTANIQASEISSQVNKDPNVAIEEDQIVKEEDLEGNKKIQLNAGQIVKRTGSTRVTFLQFMFSKRSRKDKNGAGVERVNSLERAEMAADLLDMKWSTNLSMRDRKEVESSSGNLGGRDDNSITCESVNARAVEEVVEVQSTEGGKAGLDLRESTLAESKDVNLRVVESNSGNVVGQEENVTKPGETVNKRVVTEVVPVQSNEAGNASVDLPESTVAESEEVDVRVVELDSGNVGGQGENAIEPGETVDIRVFEEVVEVQSTEGGNAGFDLHESMLGESEEVNLRVVESDSGNVVNQDEYVIKPGETVKISVVGELVQVKSTEAGNGDLDLLESTLAEKEVNLRVVELDSGDVVGQEENVIKPGETLDIKVVQVQSTETGSADLDLHGSTLAESEEVSLKVVESDSCNGGGQEANAIQPGETVKERVVKVVVEVPAKEAGNADLDMHGSQLAVSEKAGFRVVESDSENLGVPDESLTKNKEVNLRVVESDSCNFEIQDKDLVKAADSVDAKVVELPSIEVGNVDLDLHDSSPAVSGESDASLCVGLDSARAVSLSESSSYEVYVREIDADSSNIRTEDPTGVSNADNDLHEKSLTETEAGARVFPVGTDTVPVHVGKGDVVENGTREINKAVALGSLEENPRLVTVNSDSTDLLEPCSATISIETSSDTTIDKVLEVSSVDLDEKHQSENFLLQKLEVTDLPVKSTNLEPSSHTSTFGKNGDIINQYLLNTGTICKTQGTFSENSEDLQFDFSDGEREAEVEKKIETKSVVQVPSNEKEIRESEIEEADAPDPESRSETSPISIPGTSDTRDETMARSLPNIKFDFDKIEPIERLSCSLETGEVMKGKDSLSLVLKGDAKSSSDLGQIKSEAGTVDDGTVHGMCDGTTINPSVELSLCKHLLSEGMGEEAARQAFDSQLITLEKFRELGPPNLIKNEKLIVRIGGHYFPYETVAPIVLGMASFGKPAKELLNPKSMIKVDRVEPTKSIVRAGSWLSLFGFKRSKTISTISVVKEGLDGNLEESEGANGKSGRKKVRSLVPTSEELASLRLKEGPNVITFTFSTAMLGKQQVECRIFMWKWNARIVISDVDGTITRSDVLGQFMPLVGVDWSQTGVVHLFSAIKDNGYQILFLSARAISQAHLTRQFLFNLKQDGKALPDGPVVISPDGLFPSLYREVIRRAPHEFKISCLETIKALFPAESDPFYAGFGNRDTDEISYLKVGVPMGKIFIINPKGEVAVHRRVDTKSYSSLHALVNGMFPPYSSLGQEGFNDINFWRLPLPEIAL